MQQRMRIELRLLGGNTRLVRAGGAGLPSGAPAAPHHTQPGDAPHLASTGILPSHTSAAFSGRASAHLLFHDGLGGAAGRARRRRHGAHQLRELRAQRLAQAAGLPDQAEHGGALLRLAPSKVVRRKAVTPN